MLTKRTRSALLAGVLLGCVLGSAPVCGQLTAEPQSVSVGVAQGEAVTQRLTLRNGGSAALGFCLSFARPLEREPGVARLSAEALGSACGAYGEVLALVGEGDIPLSFWDPYGLAMTPEGRLFAAEAADFPGLTHELTASLGYVRSFTHPRVEELTNDATTTGVAYDGERGTLWWLNVEDEGFTVERALLLEGDLDGRETGRRIELPVAQTAPPPGVTGAPGGLAYDPRQQFFFTDAANDDLWAVDTLGVAVDGYPVRLEAYPEATLARGLDALPDDAPEGVRVELYVNPPGPTPPRHLGVVGRFGEDTAPGAAPLETPLIEPLPGTEDGDIAGEPLRSRLDPNGVLYYPWSEFGDAGVVAVRPHPLPPSWLVVEAWDGTLAPGEEVEIDLTFRPGPRAAGVYEAVLQAFEADGTVVEVPLTLEVTPTTAAEDEVVSDEASLLVYPNPSAGRGTVTVVVPASAHLRLAVFDVLGRRVAVLHDGEIGPGVHRLALDASALPSGVYLVRATGDRFTSSRRITVVR